MRAQKTTRVNNGDLDGTTLWVASYIEGRTKDNPILSREIEDTLLITGAQVRHAVRCLRRHGFWIASGTRGYWVPENKDEYLESMRHLRNRMLSLSTTLREMQASIRKVATEEQQRTLWEQAQTVKQRVQSQ
jgi:biotin operon repressor